MDRFYQLGGVTAAGILSLGAANDLTSWAWLVIAAQVAVYALLRKQDQSKTNSVPVLSPVRRPVRRTVPRSPRY